MDELVNRFLSIARDPATQSSPLNLRFAFHSLALDVITEYCFGWSMGCLSYPSNSSDPLAKLDFRHPVLVNIEHFISLHWVFKWFPILHRMPTILPKFVMKRMNEALRASAELFWSLQDQINQFVVAQEAGNEGQLKDVDHQLIFHRLMSVGRNSVDGDYEQPLTNASVIGEVCVQQPCTFQCSTNNVLIE